VWTNHRVDAWQRGGPRPFVAVWTARHLATFLDGVAEDRMDPCFVVSATLPLPPPRRHDWGAAEEPDVG
jgi:hypothetical protein